MTTVIRRILCAVDARASIGSVLSCTTTFAQSFGARVDTLKLEGQGGRSGKAILEQSSARSSDLIVLSSSPGLSLIWGVAPCTADQVSAQASCPVLSVPENSQPQSFGRILLAIDSSPATDAALIWVVALAARFRSLVTVVHALGFTSPARKLLCPGFGDAERTRGRALVDAMGERLAALGITAYAELVEERPLDAILAQSHATDLVVMGIHEGHTSRARAVGTVASVRRHSPVPVLSVMAPDGNDSFVLADRRERAAGFATQASLGARRRAAC